MPLAGAELTKCRCPIFSTSKRRARGRPRPQRYTESIPGTFLVRFGFPYRPTRVLLNCPHTNLSAATSEGEALRCRSLMEARRADPACMSMKNSASWESNQILFHARLPLLRVPSANTRCPARCVPVLHSSQPSRRMCRIAKSFSKSNRPPRARCWRREIVRGNGSHRYAQRRDERA